MRLVKRPPRARGFALLLWLLAPAVVSAQDPPPKIGLFVIDLHGTIPRFPRESTQLATSRGLDVRDLPGSGLGLHGGAHLYPLRWKALTVGVGVDLTLARAHQPSRQFSANDFSRAVTERFMHAAPELSFNFGTGDGWSYLSGGMGPSVWSLRANGVDAEEANTERLTTINYGGGARWFNTRHLAFSFDVRFYAVYPGTGDALGRLGGPRTRLLFIGGGISIK
jgi:hypothetical protein